MTISRAELIRKLSGKTFLVNFGLMNPDPFPYEEINLGICYCWADGSDVATWSPKVTDRLDAVVSRRDHPAGELGR